MKKRYILDIEANSIENISEMLRHILSHADSMAFTSEATCSLKEVKLQKYKVFLREPRCYIIEESSAGEACENALEGEEIDMVCNDHTIDKCEEIT